MIDEDASSRKSRIARFGWGRAILLVVMLGSLVIAATCFVTAHRIARQVASLSRTALSNVPIDVSKPGTAKVSGISVQLPVHGVELRLAALNPAHDADDILESLRPLRGVITIRDAGGEIVREQEFRGDLAFHAPKPCTIILAEVGTAPGDLYEVTVRIMDAASAFDAIEHSVTVWTMLCGIEHAVVKMLRIIGAFAMLPILLTPALIRTPNRR